MKLLKYPAIEKTATNSDLDRRIQKLFLIAKTLASEIETLQAELHGHPNEQRFEFDNEGIDFYREVEQYEIELIKNALDLCHGNQTHAAKLLTMKPTTLNAKVKHYGLNPARSIVAQSK